jgi:hypothetical protein
MLDSTIIGVNKDSTRRWEKNGRWERKEFVKKKTC